MNLPEPQSRTYTALMGDIEKGQVKVPNSKGISCGI